MAAAFAHMAYKTPGPKYIRLDRTSHRIGRQSHDYSKGFRELRRGEDLSIIATGYMVHQALKVADELVRHDICAGVIDLYRIKPINRDIAQARRIVTLEEHFLEGGIGSIISEILIDDGKDIKLKRIGLALEHSFQYGGRERLHELGGLGIGYVTDEIVIWLRKG